MKAIRTSVGNETFIIQPLSNEFELSVEPSNRFNGTQAYDGYFPRRYSSPRYAKAALTRFFGENLTWVQDK
jgi:hypothetical protein